MKQTKILKSILSVALVLCMVLGLCGCPAPSDGGSTTTTTTGGGGNPDGPTPTVYPNGTRIDGTGDNLTGAPMLEPTVYDAAAAVDKTEAQVRSMFRSSKGIDPNQIIRITDEAYVFSGAKSYDANGMILIAPHGVKIEDADGMTIENLTVIGALTVAASEELTLKNVRVIAPDAAVALSIDSASSSVTLDDCRVEGKRAIENGADLLMLLNTAVIFPESGLTDTSAEGLFVPFCRFSGTAGTAIKTAADNVEIRNATVKTDKDSIAIEVGEAHNLLVGACLILDAQTSVKLTGADNAAVIRNSAIAVESANGKHIYVVDNSLGGRLLLSDNDYLIADGNAYPDDEYNHAAVLSGNNNQNGNSLMDVDKRLSVGADENLLLHVDKDQFLTEERMEYVRGPEKNVKLGGYVMNEAQGADFVIIAPGAYVNDVRWTLGESHSNTVIYGYGVMAERSLCTQSPTQTPTVDSTQPHVYVTGSENVHIKGVTFAYARDAAGQVHVVEKIKGAPHIRVVGAAGFYPDFGKSNLTLFNTSGANIFREGQMHPTNGDLASHEFVERRADGSIILSVPQTTYEMLRVGDVLTCRNKVGAGAHLSSAGCSGTLFQDLVIYGNSGAACFGESYVTGPVTYLRVVDTNPAAEIIDKETYDKYKALEAQYGIHTDVRFDGTHYRGDISRYSSIDTTHIVGSSTGSQIISCLFENMCDDGTNQHSYPSRLSTVYKNDDGETATLVYKPLLGLVSYNGGNLVPKSMTHDFEVGNRLYAYSWTGTLICDAKVLSATAEAGEVTIEHTNTDGSPIKIKTYKVTVPVDSVAWEELANYPLDTPGAATSANNNWNFDGKIMVDNRSYYADGFFIDNTVVRNVRSRGLLLKASDGAVVNCTLQNLASAGISISYEHSWAESGISENIRIENNVFDNTSYNTDKQAPIWICSMGYPDFSKDSVYAHFTIKGNVMKNRNSEYAVIVEGAMDVRFEDNDFGTIYEGGSVKKKQAVKLVNVRDVVLENNTYPDKLMSVKNALTLTNVKGLRGSDVNGGDMFPDFK